MKPVKFKKFYTRRSFGVELEFGRKAMQSRIAKLIRESSAVPVKAPRTFGGWAQSVNNDYWHVKSDITCGWEVASFKAKGLEDLTHIGEVADYLAEHEIPITDDCGFHIHAEVDDFLWIKQMAALTAYWYKIEPVMIQATPEERLWNGYCCPLTELHPIEEFASGKQIQPIPFWTIMCPQNISVHNNDSKCVTLNLINFVKALCYPNYKRKTIELRLPEATLDGNAIKNWVMLFLNFIENVKTLPMPKTLCRASLGYTLQLLGLSGEQEFYILSKGLQELKVWFLKRILKYSRKQGTKRAASILLANCQI
jgi:hypothetical protein